MPMPVVSSVTVTYERSGDDVVDSASIVRVLSVRSETELEMEKKAEHWAAVVVVGILHATPFPPLIAEKLVAIATYVFVAVSRSKLKVTRLPFTVHPMLMFPPRREFVVAEAVVIGDWAETRGEEEEDEEVATRMIAARAHTTAEKS